MTGRRPGRSEASELNPRAAALHALHAGVSASGRVLAQRQRVESPQAAAAKSAAGAGWDRAPVQRMLAKAEDGMEVVHHLKAGDDPGWRVVAVFDRGATVQKGERRQAIDVPSLDWSPLEGAEEGRQLFMDGDEDWPAEELKKWAMFQYTATKYKDINAIVSGTDEDGTIEENMNRRFATTPGTPPDMTAARLIELLRETLQGLPGPAAGLRELTKGVNLEAHGDIPPRYTVGDHEVGAEFEVREFTSTSTGNPFVDRDSLIIYEGLDEVEHTGKPVPEGYTPSGNEGEVLFPPGLRYRVVEVVGRDEQRFGEMLRDRNILVETPKLNRIVRVRVLPGR